MQGTSSAQILKMVHKRACKLPPIDSAIKGTHECNGAQNTGAEQAHVDEALCTVQEVLKEGAYEISGSTCLT